VDRKPDSFIIIQLEVLNLSTDWIDLTDIY